MRGTWAGPWACGQIWRLRACPPRRRCGGRCWWRRGGGAPPPRRARCGSQFVTSHEVASLAGAGRFLLLRRLASLQSARGGLSSISPHTQVSLLAAVQRFQARTPRGTLPDGERVLWVDWSSQTLPVGLTMRCRDPGHFPSPSQSNFRSASAKAESRSVKNSYRVPSRY